MIMRFFVFSLRCLGAVGLHVRCRSAHTIESNCLRYYKSNILARSFYASGAGGGECRMICENQLCDLPTGHLLLFIVSRNGARLDGT